MEIPFVFSDETDNFRTPSEPGCGEAFTVRLRAGAEANPSVFFHLYRDGEVSVEEVKCSGRDGIYALYETRVPGVKERAEYYFILNASDGTVAYYGKNGLRSRAAEVVPFPVLPALKVPDWAKGAVWYQIFTDRFRNGDPTNDVEEGEILDDTGLPSRKAAWDEPVQPTDYGCFYGGDLQGILDKLDYLKDLGAEVLYLNPIFVAPSNHKYNTQDYDHVDPHYGVILKDAEGPKKYGVRTTARENLEASDALLAKLIAEAHKRGLRVVLDGVFNHCGAFHKWMDMRGIYRENTGEVGAWWSKDSEYASYFHFFPNGEYECWWGNRTLPKLNTDGSPALKEEIFRIAKKWLLPPYDADGWRLDVAADLGHSPEANHAFWREFREEVRSVKPDALILAEHYGDPSPWLSGHEWDSVMNYDAFMEPVTAFLTGMDKHSDVHTPEWEGDGAAFAETMERTMSRFPGQSLRAALNQLDNHDHSRFLTRTRKKPGRLGKCGPEEAETDCDKALLRSAVILQMSWPGAPGIYYGDEAGLAGFTDPDNRRPYPWGREDLELLDFYQNVLRIRRDLPVLRTGSVLMLRAEKDLIAYARFGKCEATVTLITTADQPLPVKLDLRPVLGTAPAKLVRVAASSRNFVNFGRKAYPVQNGCLETVLSPEAAEIYTFTPD